MKTICILFGTYLFICGTGYSGKCNKQLFTAGDAGF